MRGTAACERCVAVVSEREEPSGVWRLGVGRVVVRRLFFAGVAYIGTLVPLIAVTRWPSEIVFFLLLAVAYLVPLAFYVLLIRTGLVSTGLGIVLVLAAWLVPVPGYPEFLHGDAGSWGFVLLLLPVILLGIWLIGWVVDLLVRADRRLGDPGLAPVPNTQLRRPAPVAPPPVPVRRDVAIGRARPPGIVVQYVPVDPPPVPPSSPPPVPPPRSVGPHREIIDAEVIDHPAE